MTEGEKLKYTGKGFIGFNTENTEMIYVEPSKYPQDIWVTYEDRPMLVRKSDVELTEKESKDKGFIIKAGDSIQIEKDVRFVVEELSAKFTDKGTVEVYFIGCEVHENGSTSDVVVKTQNQISRWVRVLNCEVIK